MKWASSFSIGADHRVNKVLPSQDESPVCCPHMNPQRNFFMFGPNVAAHISSPSMVNVTMHNLSMLHDMKREHESWNDILC